MPLMSAGSLPAYVKKRSEKDQARWMGIWNETFRTTASETEAYRAANGALNLAAADRKFSPVTCVASDVFPDADAAGLYTVQVMRTGLWKDFQGKGYDMEIANADLADAVRNFRGSSLKPFLDYNHAITDQNVPPGEQVAIGWMRDMWIETLDGTKLEPDEAEKSEEKVLVLRATYEVTDPEANAKIASKQYALFSPTWYPVYENEETGEYQGLTIIGGAATNIPFFNGMEGFTAIAASRDRLHEMAKMLPRASLCVVAPAGMDASAAVSALEGMGFKVDSFDYSVYRVRTSEERDMVQQLAELEKAGFAVTQFYQGYIESQKGGASKANGAGPSTADVPKGSASGKYGNHTQEGGMARTPEERVRLASLLKMSEKATDAEIDEKLASLVAVAEKAPKPGEVTISAEKLKELEEGSELARKMAANAHAEKREQVIGGAVRDFKIAEAKKEQWLKRFDADPAGITEIIAEMHPDPALTGPEIGQGGGQEFAAPRKKGESRTMAEIRRLTDEAMKTATGDGKKLTREKAQNQVFASHPHLYDAYRRESTRHVGASSEGGDA